MQTIRRLYFYAVSLVSLEVVIWGLIGLLRSIVGSALLPGAETLAQALALILVGVPIFLLHWVWAQRAAAQDAEEHTASVRALFLHVALLATLIPVVSNLLALINRTLIQSAALNPRLALLGGSQTWADNLIAIALNGVAAYYFFRVAGSDWGTLTDRANFADVRRLYRYIWLTLGLLLAIFGVQHLIKYLFYIPGEMLGEPGRELFVNGLALALVGTPIWVYSWKVCQEALPEPGESFSRLRLTVLYLLALGGVITVLASGGLLLAVVLRLLLGESMDTRALLHLIDGPISIGVPLGAVWAYYGRMLESEITAQPDSRLAANLKRLYYYILSLIGLVTAFLGAVGLLSFIIDRIAAESAIGDPFTAQLANALSMLAVGLPLWLRTWRPMQSEALLSDPAGEQARRAVIRKAYLYLVLFASVIGGMVSAAGMLYLLIRAALGTQDVNFVRDLLDVAQFLALILAVLAYHLSSLRADGHRSIGATEAQQSNFRVLAFSDDDATFSESIRAAFRKHAARLPLDIQPMQAGIPAETDAGAVILPAVLALTPPEALRIWLKDFTGTKIVVGEPGSGWLAGGMTADQAARAARSLSEGQAVQFRPSAHSAWTVVAYVFAILFAAQILFLALGLAFSLLISANY